MRWNLEAMGKRQFRAWRRFGLAYIILRPSSCGQKVCFGSMPVTVLWPFTRPACSLRVRFYPSQASCWFSFTELERFPSVRHSQPL